MLVQKREVGGDHDLLRPNATMLRRRRIADQLRDPGVFVNGQLLCQRSSQLQGMELRLPWNTDGTGGGKGQGRGFDKDRRNSQLLKRIQFPIELPPVKAVDEIGLFLYRSPKSVA